MGKYTTRVINITPEQDKFLNEHQHEINLSFKVREMIDGLIAKISSKEEPRHGGITPFTETGIDPDRDVPTKYEI